MVAVDKSINRSSEMFAQAIGLTENFRGYTTRAVAAKSWANVKKQTHRKEIKPITISQNLRIDEDCSR